MSTKRQTKKTTKVVTNVEPISPIEVEIQEGVLIVDEQEITFPTTQTEEEQQEQIEKDIVEISLQEKTIEELIEEGKIEVIWHVPNFFLPSTTVLYNPDNITPADVVRLARWYNIERYVSVIYK